MFRVAIILALVMPLVTFLAVGGETVERTAQLHPAVVAAAQLLVTLTALTYESVIGKPAVAQALKDAR